MAFDIEQETRSHFASWHGFVRLTTFASIAVVVILGLMALTLL